MKGSPSKTDLARSYSARLLHGDEAQQRLSTRSLRRRRGLEEKEPYLYGHDEEDEMEADCSKREKKLKLILKLDRGVGNRGNTSTEAPASDTNSSPASSLEEDHRFDHRDFKKRRINGSGDIHDGGESPPYKPDSRKEKKKNGVSKSAESVSGLSSGSTELTPLPGLMVLKYILDKLQKLDTYGVFAEPVDPGELPDYHDIIKQPMDFGTIRKKLANDSYNSLEQLECDVFLVCSNAMEYNAPETIYHKQACAIEDMAKRRFEKLKIMSRNQMNLQSVQRMRSNSMIRTTLKKPMPVNSHEPVTSDFSSDGTLVNTLDSCIHKLPQNVPLEKSPNEIIMGDDSFLDENKSELVDKLSDSCTPKVPAEVQLEKSGFVDGTTMDDDSLMDEKKRDLIHELSDEGSQSKFERKIMVDENRRFTYNAHASDQSESRAESLFTTFDEMQQLVVVYDVGLHADYSCTRSLARFAATLGPTAWRIASQRIKQALPAGCKFGRGWVGEYEPLHPVLFLQNHLHEKPTCDFISQCKSNKVQENMKPRVAQNDCYNDATLASEISSQATRDYERNLPNLDNKLHRAGDGSGTKATAMCMERWDSSKQLNASFLSSVGKSTLSDSRNLERNSPEVDSRLMQMVSSSESLKHDVPFRQTDVRGILHSRKNGSQAGDFVTLDDKAIHRMPVMNIRSTQSNTKTTHEMSFPVISDQHLGGSPTFVGQRNDVWIQNDPARAMMLTGKIASKPKSWDPAIDDSEVNSPILTSRGDNPGVAPPAAKAWMSIGDHEQSDLSSSQIHIAAKMHNSVQERSAWVPHSFGGIVSARSKSETRLVAPPITHPCPVRGEQQSRLSRSVTSYKSEANADSSKFHVESSQQGLFWQNSFQWQKSGRSPPDLNISFQSPGSPVRQQSLGIHVDSQQPDLALQL